MFDSGSMVTTLANGIVRKMLNEAFSNPLVNEDNLVVAIRNDISMWDSAQDEIENYKDRIPPFLMGLAEEYADMVEERMGGFTNLTMMWLREDKPTFYSIIINTDGGKEWLDKQVTDILKGIGLIHTDDD